MPAVGVYLACLDSIIHACAYGVPPRNRTMSPRELREHMVRHARRIRQNPTWAANLRERLP
jgi:hypothetical protein